MVLKHLVKYSLAAGATWIASAGPCLAQTPPMVPTATSIAARNTSDLIIKDWLAAVKKPFCFFQVPTAPFPNIENNLVIDDKGIGDMTNHVFVAMHPVSAWELNEPSGNDQPTMFDDNGSYGSHYTALEYYPDKGDFDMRYFSDPAYWGPGRKRFPIKTVMIFLPGGNPFSPNLSDESIAILFFQIKVPLLPLRIDLTSFERAAYYIAPFYKPYNGLMPVCSLKK